MGETERGRRTENIPKQKRGEVGALSLRELTVIGT
jgi:hypothetical protein